jgi:hypothetical protein
VDAKTEANALSRESANQEMANKGIQSVYETTQPTRRSRDISNHSRHVSMERSGWVGKPGNRSRAKLRGGTGPVAVHTRRMGRPKKRLKITNVKNYLMIEKGHDRFKILMADVRSQTARGYFS